MIAALMLTWALGAVFLITGPVLIFSERLSVILCLPKCAKCGYDLTGLELSDRCPECNNHARAYARRSALAKDSQSVFGLWLLPPAIGLVLSNFIGLACRVAPFELVLGISLITLTFALAGIAARVMLRWMTIRTAWIILAFVLLALSVALGATMLLAVYTSTFSGEPKDIFVLSPAVIAPYAGYGLALGLFQRYVSAKRRGRSFSHSV